MSEFPIDTSRFKHQELGDFISFSEDKETQNQFETNVGIVRDMIVFMTGLAEAKGLGGHTGGAFDIVPEVLVVDGLRRKFDSIHPGFFDEAGHRVAIQYALAALDEDIEGIQLEDLLHYREHVPALPLPGHPEFGLTPGISHSSGRLGHTASFVNGVAEQGEYRTVVMFGSDGAQQEGNDAEAARYMVANNLGVVWIIDDNNITIEGKTSEYMKGFDLEKTLGGHGINVSRVKGENYVDLHREIFIAASSDKPYALIVKRPMAPGLPVEGTSKGHDAIPATFAIEYLQNKGHIEAAGMIAEALENKTAHTREYLGSHGSAKNRTEFGRVVAEILKERPDDLEKIRVISSDLGGSCGLAEIEKVFEDRYGKMGVMERGNFLAAAGFGSKPGYQGVFGTFSAFSEMVNSEITMARLNKANVLAHFSHAGVDHMSDNTCHYGTNIFFTDNGLPEEDNTRLYFPADAHQMGAVVRRVFDDPGLRFIFSTRAPNPFILDSEGNEFFAPDRYTFQAGRDEVIREGEEGYIVSYGNMLYRALDVVDSMAQSDIDVGLINKPTLNTVDEKSLERVGASPFVLVVEDQNIKTGLGSKYGTWLLERGHSPRYGRIGAVRPGVGGQAKQIGYQNLETLDIMEKALDLYTASE